jgi:uncharacterized protein (DUF1778 family)
MTPKQNKTELIKLRVTPEQKSVVVNNATKSGDTTSVYIRKQLGINEEKKEEKKPS